MRPWGPRIDGCAVRAGAIRGFPSRHDLSGSIWEDPSQTGPTDLDHEDRAVIHHHGPFRKGEVAGDELGGSMLGHDAILAARSPLGEIREPCHVRV